MKAKFTSLPILDDASLADLLAHKQHEAFVPCVPVGALYDNIEHYQLFCDLTERDGVSMDDPRIPVMPLVRHDYGFLGFSEFLPAAYEKEDDEDVGSWRKNRSIAVSFIDYRSATHGLGEVGDHLRHQFTGLLRRSIAEAGLSDRLIADPGIGWDAGFVEIGGTKDTIDAAPLWSWLAAYIRSGQYRRDADDAFAAATLRDAKADLGLEKPFNESSEGLYA